MCVFAWYVFIYSLSHDLFHCFIYPSLHHFCSLWFYYGFSAVKWMICEVLSQNWPHQRNKLLFCPVNMLSLNWIIVMNCIQLEHFCIHLVISFIILRKKSFVSIYHFILIWYKIQRFCCFEKSALDSKVNFIIISNEKNKIEFFFWMYQEQ